jgi:D-threonate/D-erythronate kinase
VIVVLADDFSGAAELAGLAASRGWSAEVQTSFDANSDAEVIAHDADTRQKSELEAVRITREVTRQVIAAKPTWIFKKTDSDLRGHIRAEIEALMIAAGYSECVFIPANPSKGRVIDGGRYLVNGVPMCSNCSENQHEYSHHPS